jgi:recombination protein RecR
LHFSSKLVEKAVESFASLPGIGKKTALRLALHMLKADAEYTRDFTRSLSAMREGVQDCTVCHNISDAAVCEICANPRREATVICVVESIRDIMAIEETSQFRGLYHVLGGVISPIDGVGPDQLNMSSLFTRIETKQVSEVILAISPTIEGETTMYYIARKLKEMGTRTSTIARGVAFGGDLEYADGLTLGRSIVARTPYHVEG